MSRIKMPKLLSDLISDLRDRHLLIPAIALVGALIAVPVLLSSQSEPVAPPAASGLAASDEAATQLDSAVISDTTGVRNYRKRLKLAHSQNPFKQQFSEPAKASVSIEDSGAEASSGGGGGVGVDTGQVTASDTSVTETTTTDPTTVNETDTTVDEQPVKPQVRFYAGRIDVAIGKPGDVKEIDDARYLDFLPSEREPVVTFVSLDGNGDTAVFALSREIVNTTGDGACSPKAIDGCELLTLKVGDERLLKYADGTTYRLRLLGTRVVRVPDPRATTSGD